MTDKQTTVYVASNYLVFSAGMIVGMRFNNYLVQRKLKKMLPLMNNALTTIFTKMLSDELTYTELRQLVEEEMEFLAIATR